MDTVNEHSTDVMTQAAELFTIFGETFAPDSIGGDDAEDLVAQGLEQYARQVARIAITAESSGYIGLYNVCVRYQQVLEPLAGSTTLSEDARIALEEWPTLVMTYLEAPTDADMCMALVEHLQNPVWVTPLSAAAAETLQHLLVPSAAAALAETSDSTQVAEDANDTIMPALEVEDDLLLDSIPTAAPMASEAVPADGTALLDTTALPPDQWTAELRAEEHDEIVMQPGDLLPDLETLHTDAISEATLDNVDPVPLSDTWTDVCSAAPLVTSTVDASDDDADQALAASDTTPTDIPAATVCAAPEATLDNATAAPEPTAWADVCDLTPLAAPTHDMPDADAREPMQQALAEADAAAADEVATLAMPAMIESTPGDLAAALASPVDVPAISSDTANECDTALTDAPAETRVDETLVDECDTTYTSEPDDIVILDSYDIPTSEYDAPGASEPDASLTTDGTFPREPDDAFTSELDEASQSLVELLYQEITQLAQSLETALTETATATEAWRQALTDHTEELERLGDGAEAMGLRGLQQVSAHMQANLLHLITQEQPLSDAQRRVVVGWAGPVLDYLQRLHDARASAALVQYLHDARWPEPLSEADGTALQDALLVTQLSVEGAEQVPPRQREAQLADISLTLPEDVNPDLLDALLQELPRQAADFSAAIQRLTTGEGTLADVDAAQRLAHSLKGAANTVGVPGIANLTHHLEDILLAFKEHGALPTRALSRTLTNAADCLEAMGETLSRMSEPLPEEETLGVLQEVLDWANLIDEEGVPGDDEICPPARATLPGLAHQPAPAAAEAEAPRSGTTMAGAATRMSADLVDELLRLAGESMILNGQLQDRLERTVQQTRTVRAQNTIMQQLVWDLEQLVDIRGVTSPLLQRTPEGEFDPLEMEQYNELHTVSRRLLESVTDILAMSQEVTGGLVTLDGLLNDQRRVQRENEEMIMRTRMMPVKTIAPRLQRSVRQACRLTGKEADLTLSGGETLMDSNVLNSMLDPLMHLLRNAVDHGIEAPERREAHGKPRTGTITLAFVREGNTVVVRCRDDGAGLDYDAIRRTALERGLIEEHQPLSEEELGRLILRAGFSTRAQTTQVSGRGIGMDVVYTRIQELKGSLSLSSEANRGCLLELRLPVSLMSTHGLLVRSGKQVFAISTLGVEQLLYPGAGTLRQVDDKLPYQLGAESYEATTLEALLNLASDQDPEQLALRPALLVREESGRHRVVLVQAVIDSLPLVVKNLGRYVPTIKGMAGATILGDGSATAVLDLPELLGNPARRSARVRGHQDAAAVADSALPVALVVDDSLSARRALADFVRDLGFEVHTAGDGLEAITSIERKVPDLLLVDLEMPRMNGLELAAHVRSHNATSHLPIIMITSRSTEKHRRNAAQAGVDVYLVKPFPEDALAVHIQQLTAPRVAA